MLQQNAIVFYYFILLFLQLKSLYNFMGLLDPHNDSLNNNILDPTLTNMPSRDWNYIPGNIKTPLDVFPCRTYHIYYSAIIPQWSHPNDTHISTFYISEQAYETENWKQMLNYVIDFSSFIHSYFIICFLCVFGWIPFNMVTVGVFIQYQRISR